MVEYQRQGLSLLHDYNTFLICFAVEITNQILWSYLKKKKKKKQFSVSFLQKALLN